MKFFNNENAYFFTIIFCNNTNLNFSFTTLFFNNKNHNFFNYKIRGVKKFQRMQNCIVKKFHCYKILL